MNFIDFSQRFFLAEPGSPEAAALARDLVEEARYPARHAIERYLSSAESAERTEYHGDQMRLERCFQKRVNLHQQ